MQKAEVQLHEWINSVFHWHLIYELYNQEHESLEKL